MYMYGVAIAHGFLFSGLTEFRDFSSILWHFYRPQTKFGAR